MNSNKIPLRETVFIAVCEAVVSAVVCIVCLALGKFDYTVLLGALLGAVVTVLNFLFLSITVNRAVDKCLAAYDGGETDAAAAKNTAESGDGEDSDPYDDSAAKFARENASKLNAAVKLSYTVRSVTVLVALILAFLTGVFDVLATAIPLLCLRPILSLAELLKKKKEKG